jgi:hypothetical protein
MAGNYPDPTSWRMALDKDGSTIVYVDFGNAIYDFTAAEMLEMQKDTTSGTKPFWGITNWYYAVVFPEKRDIDGYQTFDTRNTQFALSVETSVNTTNGADGTWVTQSTNYFPKAVYGDWRAQLVNTTVLGVKGIRWRGSNGHSNGNLYGVILTGEISPGENPDRLVLWDASANTKMPPVNFDWGFVQRSSSADRTFRVKNNSSTKQANNVTVSSDIVINTTPSVAGQLVYSYNGGAFLAQVNIGSLAPGAISGVVTCRRVTPSNAVLGQWLPRTNATPVSWT